MHLENITAEALYERVFDKLKRDKDKGDTSKFVARTSKYISWGCGIGTLVGMLEAFRNHKISDSEQSRRRFIISSTVSVAGPLLGVFYYEQERLQEAAYRTNVGQEISEQEKNELRRAANIGESAHLAGGAILVSGFIAGTFERRRFLQRLPVYGLFGFLVYNNYFQAYHGIHAATVDYVTGQEPHKHSLQANPQ